MQMEMAILKSVLKSIQSVLGKGDNHCGYIGYRQPFSNSLIDNGAINIVVEGWLKH